MRIVCDSCLTALDGLQDSAGASEMWQTINEENWDEWSPDKIMIQLSKRFRKYMPVHRCDLQREDDPYCECSGYLERESMVYLDC